MRAMRMLVSLLLITPACSSVHTLKNVKTRTIELADYAADPEKYGLPGTPSAEGMVLKIPAGTTMPLVLDTSIPFATIEAGQNNVRFDRDVYLYMGQKSFMISPDGKRWAEFPDWKAIKELYGFDKGQFAVGLGVAKDQGPFMSLVLKTEGKAEVD